LDYTLARRIGPPPNDSRNRQELMRYLLWVIFVTCLVIPLGCKKETTHTMQQKAEAALDQALDAWVRGESPDKLMAIRINDPDWKAGQRLLGFLTSQSSSVEGTPNRFRCRVALTLRDRSGKRIDREVEYSVQVGEEVVIERAAP
jgi:hypothetical protein